MMASITDFSEMSIDQLVDIIAEGRFRTYCQHMISNPVTYIANGLRAERELARRDALDQPIE